MSQLESCIPIIMNTVVVRLNFYFLPFKMIQHMVDIDIFAPVFSKESKKSYWNSFETYII